MSTLTVRFIGICCFINLPNGGKRVVMPVDTRATSRSDGAHIPYIEVEVFDQPRIEGRFRREVTYARDFVTYRRYHLDKDAIRIVNAIAPAAPQVNVLPTFTERVPALTKVMPALPPGATAAVQQNPANVAELAAYFDIEYGDLHTGPPNPFPTAFTGGNPMTQWATRRLAQWAELQIQLPDGQGPQIEVTGLGANDQKRSIGLLPRATRITIGNQLPEDIERNTSDPANMRAEDFTEHFQMYYDVLAGVPEPRVLPARTAAVPNGCVVTTFP